MRGEVNRLCLEGESSSGSRNEARGDRGGGERVRGGVEVVRGQWGSATPEKRTEVRHTQRALQQQPRARAVPAHVVGAPRVTPTARRIFHSTERKNSRQSSAVFYEKRGPVKGSYLAAPQEVAV